ncbi:MAG: vitamin K epoxide reductase family protein [bacterium]|nr:vitamin K epoxide reductase family protein [bacterium]
MIIELIAIFAAFAGFCISSYIRHKKRSNESLVCHVGSDCGAVVHSDFSKFFGIPVELLGMVYYAWTAIGHGLLLAFPNFLPEWSALFLLALSLVGFLFSAYLIFIQAFTLKQWCTWCIFSACLCTLIFGAALFSFGTNILFLLIANQSVIIIFHAAAMAIGLGAATMTDIFFFKFLKDFKISEGEAYVMRTLSQVIWFALGFIVVTGLGLLIPQAAVLVTSSKFLVKMIVILVIITNGAVLNLYVTPRLSQISFGQTHQHKPGELHHMRKVAFALGGVSITSWYTAFLLGSLSEISLPFVSVLALYLLALAIGIIGSQLMERAFSRRAFEE